MCRYPPDIASDPQIPEHLREKLLNNMLQISIKMVDTDVSFFSHNYCILLNISWLLSLNSMKAHIFSNLHI